jgi:hypothetical protein
MKLYYEIDPTTGEIIRLTVDNCNKLEYDYVLKKPSDRKFFESWRAVWPHVNPLISELKLFRKWNKAQLAFRTVGDRPELKSRALPNEAQSSYFSMYTTPPFSSTTCYTL